MVDWSDARLRNILSIYRPAVPREDRDIKTIINNKKCISNFLLNSLRLSPLFFFFFQSAPKWCQSPPTGWSWPRPVTPWLWAVRWLEAIPRRRSSGTGVNGRCPRARSSSGAGVLPSPPSLATTPATTSARQTTDSENPQRPSSKWTCSVSHCRRRRRRFVNSIKCPLYGTCAVGI